jgi:putative membrane protein
MPDPNSNNLQQDPRTYLAAERTLLAWIRTGIAMMGFGFVVARFGLFLREFQTLRPNEAPQQVYGSKWFGIGLVLMGVMVNLGAVVQHVRLVARLQKGIWHPGPSQAGIAAAISLALIGFGVGTYLLFR